MSVRTGPLKSLLAAGTPATSSTALDTFKAGGNSTKLLVSIATAGAGTLKITAEQSDNGTDFYQVLEGGKVWSRELTQANVVGNYEWFLDGLPTVPGDTVRLSYSCGNASGTVAIRVLNFENPGNATQAGESDANDTIDDISDAQRVTVINRSSDAVRCVHLIDEANIAAATYYKMWDRRGVLHGSIRIIASGGVTIKLYATNDLDADTSATTTWMDVTNKITGSGSLLDDNDMYFWDTDFACAKMMVEYVTSDSSNAVDVWTYDTP